jgi:hypothetical protein
MADHFLLFSAMGPCANREQADWLLARLKELGEADGGPACAVEREGDNLWLYSEGSFNPDLVAQAICEFQAAFSTHEPWGMEWAATCSRPLVDEFGGGAVVCCDGEAQFMNTGVWAADKLSECGRPATSKLVIGEDDLPVDERGGVLLESEEKVCFFAPVAQDAWLFFEFCRPNYPQAGMGILRKTPDEMVRHIREIHPFAKVLHGGVLDIPVDSDNCVLELGEDDVSA